MRKTSSQAYKELIESGRQHTQCEVIMAFLKNGGGFTLKELSRNLNIEINAISGRVNDLKKAGKLVEYSKRKCTITQRTVIPVGLPTEQKELF